MLTNTGTSGQEWKTLPLCLTLVWLLWHVIMISNVGYYRCPLSCNTFTVRDTVIPESCLLWTDLTMWSITCATVNSVIMWWQMWELVHFSGIQSKTKLSKHRLPTSTSAASVQDSPLTFVTQQRYEPAWSTFAFSICQERKKQSCSSHSHMRPIHHALMFANKSQARLNINQVFNTVPGNPAWACWWVNGHQPAQTARYIGLDSSEQTQWPQCLCKYFTSCRLQRSHTWSALVVWSSIRTPFLYHW